MSERGFTLIEVIIAITVIGLLAAIAVPSVANIVDDAHQANMTAVENTMNSAVIMWASDRYMDDGEVSYPAANQVTIASMTTDGSIDEWTDLGSGVWKYDPTGGTIAYSQTDGGAGYDISVSYSGAGSGGGDDIVRGRDKVGRGGGRGGRVGRH